MIFSTLSHESALFASLAVAAVAWVLSKVLRAMHMSAQSVSFQYGFAAQRGTVWGFLMNLMRLVMWCALASSALSLVLNLVRFARAS